MLLPCHRPMIDENLLERFPVTDRLEDTRKEVRRKMDSPGEAVKIQFRPLINADQRR
jgi:hypothetical protein